MKSKTKRIQEIAKETGISLATVYRAATAPHTVSEETRHRILKIMEERKVSVAKRTRHTRRPKPVQRTDRVVFLVPQLAFRTVEMITEEMMHGIQKVFSPRGIDLVLYHYAWDGDAASPLPSVLNDQTVDGILLRPPANRPLLERFCQNRKAVLLGNGFADLEVPSVMVDDEAAIRMAMEYLFELGHRRTAFVSLAPTMLIYRRRLDAYVANLFHRNIAFDNRLIKLHNAWTTSVDEGNAVYKRFAEELLTLDTPPTAIVCSSDSFAAGLMAAARERGIRVPEQVSITGFGDQYFAALADPPLTTIHVDQRAIGEVAATQLLQLIDGVACPTLSLIRPTLIERRSCAALERSK